MIDEGLCTKDENNSYLYIFQQDEITRNDVETAQNKRFLCKTLYLVTEYYDLI